MIILNHNLSAVLAGGFLEQSGKMYAVVLGIVIIFLGLASYLWSLDKKITQLENEIKNGK
jgi:CcmD family protein